MILSSTTYWWIASNWAPLPTVVHIAIRSHMPTQLYHLPWICSANMVPACFNLRLCIWFTWCEQWTLSRCRMILKPFRESGIASPHQSLIHYQQAWNMFMTPSENYAWTISKQTLLAHNFDWLSILQPIQKPIQNIPKPPPTTFLEGTKSPDRFGCALGWAKASQRRRCSCETINFVYVEDTVDI